MPTLAELDAQQKELDIEKAKLEKIPLADALAQLEDFINGGPVEISVADIDGWMAQLPNGEGKKNLGNLKTVLNAVPQILKNEIKRVDAVLASAEGDQSA